MQDVIKKIEDYSSRNGIMLPDPVTEYVAGIAEEEKLKDPELHDLVRLFSRICERNRGLEGEELLKAVEDEYLRILKVRELVKRKRAKFPEAH